MNRYTLCLLAAAGVSLATAVPTAYAEGEGFYVGGGAGVSRGTIKDGSINQTLSKNSLTTGGVQSSGSDSFAFKVFLGYSLSKYLALEGGYFNLGNFNYTAVGVNSLGTAGSVNGEANAWGGNFDLVGILPLGNWRLLARGGIVYTRSNTSLTSSTLGLTQTEFSDNSIGWKAGLGVGYEFPSKVGFRAEWEVYKVDDGTGENMYVNTAMASVLYKF